MISLQEYVYELEQSYKFRRLAPSTWWTSDTWTLDTWGTSPQWHWQVDISPQWHGQVATLALDVDGEVHGDGMEIDYQLN